MTAKPTVTGDVPLNGMSSSGFFSPSKEKSGFFDKLFAKKITDEARHQMATSIISVLKSARARLRMRAFWKWRSEARMLTATRIVIHNNDISNGPRSRSVSLSADSVPTISPALFAATVSPAPSNTSQSGVSVRLAARRSLMLPNAATTIANVRHNQRSSVVLRHGSSFTDSLTSLSNSSFNSPSVPESGLPTFAAAFPDISPIGLKPASTPVLGPLGSVAEDEEPAPKSIAPLSLDGHAAVAPERPVSPSPLPSLHIKIPDDTSAQPFVNLRAKWRFAIRKAIQLVQTTARLTAALQPEKRDEHTDVLPQRLADYFLVFAGKLPANLADKSSDSVFASDEVEKLLAEFGPNSAGLDAEIVDRYPRKNYAELPVEPAWANFAYPHGCIMERQQYPPSHHFATMTLGNGSHVYATFLTFYEPIQALLLQQTFSSKETSGKVPASSPMARRAFGSRVGTGSVESRTRGRPTMIYVPRVICLVSHYPIIEVLKESLSQLLSMESHSDSAVAVEKYVMQLCHEIPLPIGQTSAVQFHAAAPAHAGTGADPALLTVTMPAVRHPLASAIPLDTLFAALGIDTIFGIVASLLTESRVLFHSHSRSKLVRSIMCFQQLLYPFLWTSVCIPLLPADMLDACAIPQPYMIGIESRLLSELTEVTEIVMVDLDHNCIRSTDPLPRLPAQAASALWTELRNIVERRVSALDDVMPELSNRSVASHTIPSASPKSDGSSTEQAETVTYSDMQRAQTASTSALPDSLYLNFPRAYHPRTCAFDRDVYAAFLTFYASVLSGYRRFLFFIDEVPFFNATSFMMSKPGASALPDKKFFDQFLESRAFSSFLEESPTAFHDFIATESRHHLESIANAEQKPLDLVYVRPPVADTSAAEDDHSSSVDHGSSQAHRDSKLSPVLRLSVSLSMAIAYSTGAPSYAPSLGSSLSMSTQLRMHPEFVEARGWQASYIDTAARIATPSVQSPAPAALSPQASDSNAPLSSPTVAVSRAPLAAAALAAAAVANKQSFVCPFVKPLRESYLQRSAARQCKPIHRVVEVPVVHRIRHFDDRHSIPQAALARRFMAHLFAADRKVEQTELVEITNMLRDASVRASVASIVRSPFTRDGSDNSGGRKTRQPVSFALSSGPAPSLCLSANSFDAMATVLLSLLNFCHEQRDFANAVCAVDSATVFYRDSAPALYPSHSNSISARHYIEREIRSHALFRDVAFWSYVIDSEVLTTNFATDAARQEFVLSYLIQCTHKMLSLGVDAAMAHAFIISRCDKFELNGAQRATLDTFAVNIAQAIEMDNM